MGPAVLPTPPGPSLLAFAATDLNGPGERFRPVRSVPPGRAGGRRRCRADADRRRAMVRPEMMRTANSSRVTVRHRRSVAGLVLEALGRAWAQLDPSSGAA